MPFNEKMHTEFSKLILDKTRGDRLVLDGEEYMQAVYNGQLVFNRALYHIEVSDLPVRFEAVGGPFTAEVIQEQMNLRCYKTDCDGKKSDVYGFEYVPASLDANESEEELDGTFTVTHIDSGLSVEGTWRQNKDELLRTEYRSVRAIDAAYDMIPASGGTVCPIIYYSAVRTKVYASGREDQQYVEMEATVITDTIITVSSDYWHVSADQTTGCITADSLRDFPHDYDFPIAQVHRLVSTDINGDELVWEGLIEVMQGKNKPYYGDWQTSISSSLPNGNRITFEQQDVVVRVSAFRTRYGSWDSGYPYEEREPMLLELAASAGSLSQSQVYGGADVSWTVPMNNGSERNLSVRVYNAAAGYDKTHTVTQDAYVATEYWGTPVMYGSITWQIPANGAAVSFVVPLRQYKYKDGDIIGTYEWNAVASYVSGSPITGNASFSGGKISCDTLGDQYYPSGRNVFYATQIMAYGKDGVEYNIEIPDNILTISQAANVQEETDSRYSITSSMDNAGGTLPASESRIRVRATAYKWVKYTWSSGAPGGEYYEPVPLYVKTNVTSGITTISNSINGSVTEINVGTNTGNTTREIEVTVYNNSSGIGYSETFSITQEAHVQIVTWTVPHLNGDIAWEIPASGMAVPFYVPVIQYKVIDGVRQEPGTSWYAQATYVSGDVLNNSEAAFSGGYISCETRGTNYAETPRDVFRAKVVKIEDLNGSEVEVNLPYSIVIKQSLNVYETRYGERHLSFTKPTDGSWVDSAGATVVVQVACYQESYREYSSLAREPLSSVSGEAKLSSNPTQSALPSTLADGVEARFWMAENTGSSTKSVQLTATYGSLSESVTVYQYAVSYALSITSSSSVNVAAQVGTSGKLIEFKGLSTRNGRPFVGSGNISVSVVGSTQLVHSIGTLVFDSETGAFTVPVTVYNNTSTSARSLTIRVTQASSGYTETLTITQDAMVATDNIKWGNAYYYSGLQNTMTARLLFKSGVSAVVFYYKINGVTQGSVQNLSLVSQGTQGEWKYMDITRTQQFDYLNSTVQFVAEYNSEVETVTLEYKGGGDIT